MIRISAISTLTLCLFALTLEAQTSTDLSSLAKYPTRLTLTTNLRVAARGYLYSAGDTTVQLLKSFKVHPQTGEMDIQTVPANLLYSLEFKVGKSRKKGALIGAAIGAGVGLGLALVLANEKYAAAHDISEGAIFAYKGFMFLAPTALGAGIGYWAGGSHFGVKFDIGGKQSEYERQKKDIQKYSMMR